MPVNPAIPPKLHPEARLHDRIAQLERQVRTLVGYLNGGSVQQQPVVDSLPTPGRLGRTLILSTDKKLYRDDGVTWVAIG